MAAEAEIWLQLCLRLGVLSWLIFFPFSASPSLHLHKERVRLVKLLDFFQLWQFSSNLSIIFCDVLWPSMTFFTSPTNISNLNIRHPVLVLNLNKLQGGEAATGWLIVGLCWASTFSFLASVSPFHWLDWLYYFPGAVVSCFAKSWFSIVGPDLEVSFSQCLLYRLPHYLVPLVAFHLFIFHP